MSEANLLPIAEQKPSEGASWMPLLDAAALSALYPKLGQRQVILTGVLEYTRRDREETMKSMRRGHYAQARCTLHRIKGTVCLLTCDTKGYALFDRVDHKLQYADLHEKEAAMKEMSLYLDGLERSLESAVRDSVTNRGKDDDTICDCA
jgi:hypothetical protein